MYYVNSFGGFLWEEIIQDFGGGEYFILPWVYEIFNPYIYSCEDR